MSDKRYEANIIRATAVEPSNNLEITSAPGVWSLDEVMELQKKDKWPTVGNAAPDVTDVFSTFLYEGNGLGQPIENGIKLGNSNDGGSVKFGGNSSGDYITFPSSSDFAFGTGDFTVEAFVNVSINNGNGFVFQISSDSNYYSATAANQLNMQAYLTDFQYGNNANFSLGSTTISYGQFVHLAMARSGTTLKFFVNGSEAASVTDSTNYTGTYLAIGIGYGSAYSLDGYISNFRVVKGTAVYTSAFTAPTSALTAITNTKLLTLQGDTPFVDNSSSARTATQLGSPTASELGPFTGTSGEGGLVWIKRRDGSDGAGLFDTVRGATKGNFPSSTSAETTDANSLTSFNANGFSVGTGYTNFATNGSGQEYVGWTWRKRAKYFDIVQYTGDGTDNREVAHNLGQVPGMIIIKSTTNADTWKVWHKNYTGAGLYLNDTGVYPGDTVGYNTTQDADVIKLANNGVSNVNSRGYIAYLFADHNNDGTFGPLGNQDIIKCGNYTGNGSATGPIVDLGFEPQWLMIKSTSAAHNWIIVDVMRGWSTKPEANTLLPNSSAAEDPAGTRVKPLSNGFQIITSSNDYNQNTHNFIYMAIRRGPLATPTSATDFFEVSYGENASANGRTFPTTFPVDFFFYKNAGGGSSLYSYFLDRVRGTGQMIRGDTDGTESNQTYNDQFDHMDGIHSTGGYDYSTWIGWSWRRAAGYFDICGYTGDGTSSNTARTAAIPHNLGVQPEMIWVKRRGATSEWVVAHKDYGAGYLNLNNAFATYSSLSTTHNDNFTAATFKIGAWQQEANFNVSGADYIAYLFATAPGVSKVGSFSHTNGSDTNVDCGFTSGAKFVVIKRLDNTSNWYVFDTVRGIVAGSDKALFIDTDIAQQTADWIDPLSSGFTATGAAWSTGTYLFWAIAT